MTSNRVRANRWLQSPITARFQAQKSACFKPTKNGQPGRGLPSPIYALEAASDEGCASALLTLHCQRAAMLLRDDVVAQAQAGSAACRVPHFVVRNPNLNLSFSPASTHIHAMDQANGLRRTRSSKRRSRRLDRYTRHVADTDIPGASTRYCLSNRSL